MIEKDEKEERWRVTLEITPSFNLRTMNSTMTQRIREGGPAPKNDGMVSFYHFARVLKRISPIMAETLKFTSRTIEEIRAAPQVPTQILPSIMDTTSSSGQPLRMINANLINTGHEIRQSEGLFYLMVDIQKQSRQLHYPHKQAKSLRLCINGLILPEEAPEGVELFGEDGDLQKPLKIDLKTLFTPIPIKDKTFVDIKPTPGLMGTM